jgi:hypothetical protein
MAQMPPGCPKVTAGGLYCFVPTLRKIEAMAEEMKGRVVGGEGKVAEVDGGYFGGYVRPANMKADRLDRRYTRNQSGKRKVVVIVRERGGNSVPAVCRIQQREPRLCIHSRPDRQGHNGSR